jgi:hypothetical protein
VPNCTVRPERKCDTPDAGNRLRDRDLLAYLNQVLILTARLHIRFDEHGSPTNVFTLVISTTANAKTNVQGALR